MNQFVLPKQFIPDSSGTPIVGAKVYFYQTGTLQSLTVFQDALFATAHDPENITSDADGVFPAIFIKDQTYKCAVYDADNVLMSGPHDNLAGQIDLSSIVSSQQQYNSPIIEIQTDRTISANEVKTNTFFNTKPISQNIVIELPSAAEVGNGYGLTIRDAYASEFSISIITKGGSSETIDDAASMLLTTFDENVRLVSDGANWIGFKYNVPNGAISIDQLDPRLKGSLLSTGMLVQWVGLESKAPVGWLLADGQIVNIDDYPDLYDKYGIMYGGDGVTTFGIPDLRGYVIRGVDDGAGRDPDAASRTARPDGVLGDNIGTTQDDDFASHAHTGSIANAGEHSHSYSKDTISFNLGGGGYVLAVEHQTGQTGLSGDHTHALTINAAGGNETRMKNFGAKIYVVAAPELNAGASGVLTKIHSSIGTPSDSVGINGDFVFDTANKIMYGPKTGGTYISYDVQLSGLDGVSNIFVQELEPSGNDGDLWLRSLDGQLIRKSSGAWNDTGLNLIGSPGTPGSPGTDGTDGLDGNDGAKGLSWLGAWSSATSYIVDDAVSIAGASYICVSPNTNQAPPNVTFWGIIAEKGNSGSGTGDMVASNNLSDLVNTTTARGNLGLAALATKATVNTVDLDNDAVTADKLADEAFTTTEKAKLLGLEDSATADQTDIEIETAYSNQVSQVNASEITAGTETAVRRFSPADVKSIVTTHGGSGGGGASTDLLDLSLRVADLEGDALGLIDGIADPFDDETDVDASNSFNELYQSAGDYYQPTFATNTNYSNTGGQGDRTGVVTVNTDISIGGGAIGELVDGSDTNQSLYFSGQATSGKYLKFDFGTAHVINEMQFIGNNAADQGFWKWQGSNDDTIWTDIGLSFNWTGSATYTDTSMAANTTAFRYYRMFGTSGSISGSLYFHECKFKIGDSASAIIDNMTLISKAFIADSVPSEARILFHINPIDSITINTDVIASVSRDDGVTWSDATLAAVVTHPDGTVRYEDNSIDLSGQPTGTAMKWKLETANDKNINVSGVVLQWS